MGDSTPTPGVRWALTFACLVGLLLGGGCEAAPEPAAADQDATTATAGPSARAPVGTPTSPTSTLTAPPASSGEELVLAAYERFWEVYVAAASRSDPDHPELERVATGRALEGLQIQLAGDREAGVVARGQPERWATRLTRLDADRAELVECVDSNRWLLHDAATGELRDTPSGIVRQVTAALTRSPEGSWKVAELDIGTSDMGETACAR